MFVLVEGMPMSADGARLTDTRYMVAVHDALRRALVDAPRQLASVRNGDTQRARYLVDYLDEVLWLLRTHHVGEDELLYPLLSQRAPERQELYSRMGAQYVAVSSSLEAADRAIERFGMSGSVADGQALASVCEWLLERLVEHLNGEEQDVLPIAARCVSPPEWRALSAHALTRYCGTREWLPFGLMLEATPDDGRDDLFAQLALPVSEMWFAGGSDAFAKEMAVIRTGGV
jgi:hemerythrin-like domain-containing protein